MRTFIIGMLLLSGCIVLRNKADAQVGGLLWSTSVTGPWYNSTPNSWCDGSQPSVVSWRMDCNFGGPMGGFGANPYRYTVWLYRDGNLIYNNSYQLSSYYATFYDYNEPLIAGTYDVKIKFELRKITGWQTYSEQTWNHITMDIPECCPSSKVITGTWTKPLQESASFITSSGTTIVPNGANVKLDAAADSYILLNDGFEAQSGSVFVAQAYNGCSAGAPSIAVHNKDPHASEDDLTKSLPVASSFVLYPNPTNGEVTIEHTADAGEILIFDLLGNLLQRVTAQEGGVTRIDLSDQPAGTYLIKVGTGQPQRLIKR